jgi:hypothetical protein
MAADHTASEHLAVDFGIVLHAWGTLRRALRALPKVFISAVLATALLTFAAWKLQGLYHGFLAGAPDDLRTLIEFLYTLIVDLCDCVVIAAVAVPVHRLVILDEVRDGTAPFLGARTWRSALWLVVFELMGFGALLPLPLLMSASGTTTIAIVAGMAAFLAVCFVVVLRLSLIFPAIAIDPRAVGHIVESWSLSRGHFWRLFITFVFAMIPLLLGILLVTLALSAVVGRASSLIGMFDALMWFEIAVTALSRPLAAALGAAVLAWNYKLACSERAEPA